MPIKTQNLELLINYENIIYYIFIAFVNYCAGNNMAKVKIGKRCTTADASKLQESSYVWFVSKDAAKDFDKRINKSNCLGS